MTSFEALSHVAVTNATNVPAQSSESALASTTQEALSQQRPPRHAAAPADKPAAAKRARIRLAE